MKFAVGQNAASFVLTGTGFKFVEFLYDTFSFFVIDL